MYVHTSVYMYILQHVSAAGAAEVCDVYACLVHTYSTHVTYTLHVSAAGEEEVCDVYVCLCVWIHYIIHIHCIIL